MIVAVVYRLQRATKALTTTPAIQGKLMPKNNGKKMKSK
jgi:hypothetical protein